MKKYHIIYADPPWYYNDRKKNTKFGAGVHGHYPVMKAKDIKDIDVASISEDNSVLFMWATFPRLPQALQVIEAWGFTYKTLGFSWHKLTRDGKLFFGVGAYAKSNCEVCLMKEFYNPRSYDRIDTIMVSDTARANLERLMELNLCQVWYDNL